MRKRDRPPITMLTCDQCGGTFAECEFAETIEEFLCERCASGIEEDDCDEGCHDGFDDASGEV